MKIEIINSETGKKLSKREAKNVLKIAFEYLHDMYKVVIFE